MVVEYIGNIISEMSSASIFRIQNYVGRSLTFLTVLGIMTEGFLLGD
jgi:hypothetical protein